MAPLLMAHLLTIRIRHGSKLDTVTYASCANSVSVPVPVRLSASPKCALPDTDCVAYSHMVLISDSGECEGPRMPRFS